MMSSPDAQTIPDTLSQWFDAEYFNNYCPEERWDIMDSRGLSYKLKINPQFPDTVEFPKLSRFC